MSFTKIKQLYIAVNHVVAELGKDGEIQRRSEFVEDLMMALHAIDIRQKIPQAVKKGGICEALFKGDSVTRRGAPKRGECC